MQITHRTLLALGLLCLASSAGAAEDAVEDDAATLSVPTVDAPAWLEREGERRALRSGDEVRVADSLVTGDKGAANVALPDGATLRLDSGARLDFDYRDAEGDGAVYLRLARGRLRYSGRLGVPAVPTYIDLGELRVTVTGSDSVLSTAGRGGEVLLLAGEVSLEPPAAASSRRSTPFSRYEWSPGQGVRVTELASEEAHARAATVGAGEGTGATVADAGWVVNLMSMRDAEGARRAVDRLKSVGVEAEMNEFSQDGTVWHRVQVTGFTAENEARAFAESIRGRHGVRDTWVFER